VVVIGDSAVGKTSLIQMFEHNKFTEAFKPTIGADFSNKEVQLEDRIATLQIWDTAGQERFQSLGSAFYRGADCCCLVYDVTNPLSFEHLMNWRQIFMNKSAPKEPQTFPFLVIGNKVDLEDKRQVSGMEARKFCQQNGGMLFYETSAKDNLNVEKAFKDITVKALERQDSMRANQTGAMPKPQGKQLNNGGLGRRRKTQENIRKKECKC